jgi:serine protease Do
MQQPPRKKKRGMKKVAIGLCCVAGACLLFAGGAAIGHIMSGGVLGSSDSQTTMSSSQPATLQIASTPDYDPDNYDVVNGLAGEEIYKKVSPSIVSVVTESGSGSGVIMSEDGYIITNNHVVSGATSVYVLLSDATQLDATIVGLDEQTDLAVLKVNTTAKLTAAEFGDSDALQPGEYAYAIGSPGGVKLANTITGGRISAINRDLTVKDRVMSLIQTDASINPGNSGGALINKYGQVVGITSAKISGSVFSSSSYEGLGFAIPINTAKDIVDELIANGYVSGRPSIGITGQSVAQGIYVYSIDSRAHAYTEGLQVGDIITKVNGTNVTSMTDINDAKGDLKAGDTIQLTVYRMATGQTLELTITLTDEHDLEGDDPAESANSSTSNSNSSSSYGSYGSQDPFSYFFGWNR